MDEGELLFKRRRNVVKYEYERATMNAKFYETGRAETIMIFINERGARGQRFVAAIQEENLLHLIFEKEVKQE